MDQFFQGRFIGGEFPHLSQKMIKGIVKVSLDFQISVHVSFSKSQRSAGEKFCFWYWFFKIYGKFRFSFSDKIFFAIQFYLKGIVVKFPQKGDHNIFQVSYLQLKICCDAMGILHIKTANYSTIIILILKKNNFKALIDENYRQYFRNYYKSDE